MKKYQNNYKMERPRNGSKNSMVEAVLFGRWPTKIQRKHLQIFNWLVLFGESPEGKDKQSKGTKFDW